MKLVFFLQVYGVGFDELIGIYIDCLLYMVVGFFGILKVGGVYVLFDFFYFVDRLEYMIVDSRILMCLMIVDLEYLLNWGGVQIAVIDCDWYDIEQIVVERMLLKWLVIFDDLVYVIYMLGSMGKLKGVMILYWVLMNFLLLMVYELGFLFEDKLFVVMIYCFDIVVLELYFFLIKGVECNICKIEVVKDVWKLKELI